MMKYAFCNVGTLNNRFDVMVNMPDVAHKTSIFNGIVGLIRRVKHFGSKVSSQCFGDLLVQIAREIFQPFQLFQRRAHFLLTFGIVTFQANQRFNQT